MTGAPGAAVLISLSLQLGKPQAVRAGLGTGVAPTAWAGAEALACLVPEGHSWSCWEESVPLCGWEPLASAQVPGRGIISQDLTEPHPSATPDSQRQGGPEISVR